MPRCTMHDDALVYCSIAHGCHTGPEVMFRRVSTSGQSDDDAFCSVQLEESSISRFPDSDIPNPFPHPKP